MKGVELEKKQTAPDWEIELWSCLDHSNGNSCPLYDQCNIRRSKCWCPAEHLKEIRQFTGCEYQDIDIRKTELCMLYGKIFQLIDKLAQKYISSCQGCDLPVPLTLVHSVDNLHKIEIRHIPLHKMHGALWYIGRHWIIQVNKNDPPDVQKFTVFHEAFHIIELLNLHRKLDEQKYQRHYFDEVLADQFASCILMPVDMVRNTWFLAGNLHQVAKVFDVSEPIAAFRLKCLHLI